MVERHPTPYPDVNKTLQLVLAETQNVLGKQFAGMYLFGSLSSGDFHPEASDIDYLIVTTDLLAEETITNLEAMHVRIWNMGLAWAARLECSYLPAEHLRHYQKTGQVYPTVNEGHFYKAPHGSDWIIQRHIIREYGVVLAGSDPKGLIDPVGPDEIRGAVTGILQEWWFPLLDDPCWLRNHGSEYHAFAILTMCRALHALDYGTIVSKLVAADWAQQELDAKWAPLIEQSLATRMGSREFELYDSALELIRYMMERVENKETN